MIFGLQFWYCWKAQGLLSAENEEEKWRWNKNRKDATKNFPTICIENALEQIDIDTIPTLLTFFLKMRVS